jgi:hypothetical protein
MVACQRSAYAFKTHDLMELKRELAQAFYEGAPLIPIRTRCLASLRQRRQTGPRSSRRRSATASCGPASSRTPRPREYCVWSAPRRFWSTQRRRTNSSSRAMDRSVKDG